MSDTERMRRHDYGPEHRLERLAFFSDAVFAIAITLLVIEIHVPHLEKGATDGEWLKALWDLGPEFAAYCLSFYVIGALWIRHHKTFSMLSTYDDRLMWPNLVFLMSIAFLPFSTALVTVMGHSRVPFLFYDLSLLAAGLLKVRLTLVAMSRDLVSPHVTAQEMIAERRGSWILPIATLAALALAFVVPLWNNLAMFLIAVLRRLPYFAGARTSDDLIERGTASAEP